MIKVDFFEDLMLLKSKSAKTNESLDITWGIFKRNCRSKDILRIFTNFYGAAPQSISGQQLPQILPPSN
jgi:hypothetical protein